MNALRIAIIGAGPAGIYAADILRKAEINSPVTIDIFEQLPAPYGLVRYGVSPDHPRIKGIIGALKGILDSGQIRLFGNVRYGDDITIEDLKRHYHGVIFATGAIRDQSLNISGIEAEGSFGAADFVSWFDAHPDVPLDWPLEAESVAVVGNGNVALDVSRMLVKQPDDLVSTEIPDNVLEGLRANNLKELHLFGRRGPGAVKFTPLELRELGEVRDVEIVLNEADFEIQDDHAEAQKQVNKQLIIIGRIFDAWRKAQRERETDTSAAESRPASRKLYMHFWSKPVEVLSTDGKVSGFRVERTAPDGSGGVISTGETRDVAVQAIYRAVGYLGSALDGVPFDENLGVINNVKGVVVDAAGEKMPGMFVTGWIKRGPVGLIGHTKSDAAETVAQIVENLDGLWSPSEPDEASVSKMLVERGLPITTIDGWDRLDKHEMSLGEAQGRLRKKVQSRSEMTKIARLEEPGKSE
ncbi:MAG TPA: FAD-dependent oxidoreductase [Microbacteriaceae bacterium]|nr:FAD-dependent oxidoreductase [Microbacteriaceae bacterium]